MDSFSAILHGRSDFALLAEHSRFLAAVFRHIACDSHSRKKTVVSKLQFLSETSNTFEAVVLFLQKLCVLATVNQATDFLGQRHGW